MARVIVILGLMIAITATMFWITRKPSVATDASATPAAPSAMVSLAELKSAKTPGPDEDLTEKPDEAHSAVSAEPRLVTNPAAEGAPASAQDVTGGPIEGAAPTIGPRGVDKKGQGSFGGTAAPGDAVSLMWDEKPIAWTTADATGKWTIEFKAPDLKREHELYVVAKGRDGTEVRGPQRVVVGPPVIPGGDPGIEMAMADPAKVSPPDEPTMGIIVEKSSAGEAGAAQLVGRADPGATMKAEVNGKPAGETVVAADGTWSLKVANASGKAADNVQLVLLGKDGRSLDNTAYPLVVAAPATQVAANETKTSKDYPAVLTSKPGADGVGIVAKPDIAAMFERPADVAPEKPKRQVIRVRRGDSLWRISKRHLGNGKKWSRFYRLNKRKIDNPDLIYPGQTLILPG